MSDACALEWRDRDGLRWLEWRCAGAVAAFPSREGGVSPAPYASLDLGYSVADDAANVRRNRERLGAALGMPVARWVVPGQVHGLRLAAVGEGDAGRGAFGPDDVVARTDGLRTVTPDLGLAVSYADCVPVVIVAAGDGGPALATVHAGWRGMIEGIVERAAAELLRGRRLVGAVIGPSIGPCCFRVDDGLRGRFEARWPGSAGDETVDLWAVARRQLEAAGVPPAAVITAGICTADDERFFSHRRERGLTGRHLAIAWLESAAGDERGSGRETAW